MSKHKWENCIVQPLINEFFEQDDIKKLAEDVGIWGNPSFCVNLKFGSKMII